jgi:hypothetical protein
MDQGSSLSPSSREHAPSPDDPRLPSAAATSTTMEDSSVLVVPSPVLPETTAATPRPSDAHRVCIGCGCKVAPFVRRVFLQALRR